MPKVKIPTPLRQYTGGNTEVEVGGATVFVLPVERFERL